MNLRSSQAAIEQACGHYQACRDTNVVSLAWRYICGNVRRLTAPRTVRQTTAPEGRAPARPQCSMLNAQCSMLNAHAQCSMLNGSRPSMGPRSGERGDSRSQVHTPPSILRLIRKPNPTSPLWRPGPHDQASESNASANLFQGWRAMSRSVWTAPYSGAFTSGAPLYQRFCNRFAEALPGR